MDVVLTDVDVDVDVLTDIVLVDVVEVLVGVVVTWCMLGEISEPFWF